MRRGREARIDSLLLLDGSVFCNAYGSVRLALVRKYFGECPTLKEFQKITSVYTEWRDYFEFMPIRLTFEEAKYIDLAHSPAGCKQWIDAYENETRKPAVRFNEASEIVCFTGIREQWIMKKSCKRGNDVYIQQITRKFKPLLDSKNHKQFFSTEINKQRKRVRKTQLLYLTGTTSPDPEYRPRSNYYKTISISKAWLDFGKWWNSFITNIREQFGKVEYIRAWQSQENGYPHFHALVYFNQFKFTAYRHKEFNEKKNKWEYVWRVHNRQMLNKKPVRERIKNAWVWGWLDVKCCENTKKALDDIHKYITRSLEGGESDLTNAIVWYYGKQAYALSKGFTDLFEPDIDLAEPGNDEFINAVGVIPRSNSKEKLIRIEIFPMIPKEILDFSYTKNVLDPWKVPDPPPKVILFLENFVDECKVSSVKKNDDVEIVLYKRDS